MKKEGTTCEGLKPWCVGGLGIQRGRVNGISRIKGREGVGGGAYQDVARLEIDIFFLLSCPTGVEVDGGG